MRDKEAGARMQDNDSMQALVIGAGGIGSAIAERWSNDGRFDRIWSISRRAGAVFPSGDPGEGGRIRALQTDHQEESMRRQVASITAASPRLARVVIALGTLHADDYQPEKSLEALSGDAMQAVYQVNCVLPLLWLAALAPALRKSEDCRIAVLSARVGSIEDNRMGGWYSYRSAKAALNMGLRSASIEMARRARGIKLIAYHPGTVDSDLSKPFQRGVPDGKLFTPAFAAERLDAVLDQHRADGELAYVDWAGETIPW
jgi:NAD(P)-dependent dehydrogenase (short-subunit alcohol dehydrogenase family)